MDYSRFLSNGSRRIRRSEIREILKHAQSPGVISFAGGLPAPDMFPIAQIKQIAGDILDRQGASVLQYGQTEGYPRLREELSKLLGQDGATVPAERIMIVTSSQQGLDIVGKLLLDPGDVVVTSRPTYLGAIQSFTAMGAHLQGVELDEEGMRTDLVEDTIRRFIDLGRKPKFIYENPDFQNPSGVTMSLRRRRELLRIAERYDMLVVEDSPYRALCFEGEPEPSLLSMNDERVMSLFTFSKILAPAFRMGWLAGPSELLFKAVAIKQAADLCTSEFLQAVAAEFLGRGLLNDQIARIKAAYREK